MRLIDADELLTAFPVDDEPTLTKSCVRMTIKNMPTIEPQTKKGYWRNLKLWIDGDSSAECSECDAVVHTRVCDALNFCPNCGADMIGVVNE